MEITIATPNNMFAESYKFSVNEKMHHWLGGKEYFHELSMSRPMPHAGGMNKLEIDLLSFNVCYKFESRARDSNKVFLSSDFKDSCRKGNVWKFKKN